MLILFAFQLVTAMDCTFETAFEKGQQDVETNSFGANIDRFCLYAPEKELKEFPKSYELGRQYGPTLKKAGIVAIPKNKTEMDGLLKDASLAMATKEIVDRVNKSPKEGPTLGNPEIQNLTKRIEGLEAENKRLTEKLNEESNHR